MKAPPFSYVRPQQLAEVFALLEQHGDDARLLAGGQTLLASLNMRLSEPALLIDLQDLDELQGLSRVGNCLRIGAMVSHSQIESSSLVAQHAPLLSQAAPHIAHRAIRNLGTFGGSIAYGDPAAEWPACLLALDGVVVVQSRAGERRIAAQDFYTGLYGTALISGEVIVACEIPVAPTHQRYSFQELARRQGDYAVLGLAACGHWHHGALSDLRLAWLGLGAKAQRATETEQLLQDQPLSDSLRSLAVQRLVHELDIAADLTHSVASKKHLAGVLLNRTLDTLCAAPQEGPL
ncbi:MAG: xanthine dehydrogenase family protein subunit M [Burkholderiaceae bacterium]